MMAFEKAPVVEKTNLMLNAFQKHKVRYFLDLGGCWGVNGAYTFQSLLAFEIERAIIVDSDITSQVKQRGIAFPQLELIEGSFGNSEIVERVGNIDAVVMYDILLHQVKPNWDEVIELYSRCTNVFVIYNQMWTGSENTIRLFDLGFEEYAANTPYGSGNRYLNDRVKKLISSWDEIDPETGRKYQDQHSFWQWGIVLPDLIKAMWIRGFKLELMKDYGSFHGLEHFEDNGFVFVRSKQWFY